MSTPFSFTFPPVSLLFTVCHIYGYLDSHISAPNRASVPLEQLQPFLQVSI